MAVATRETAVMESNAFASSEGTSERSAVQFKFTKLRPGVYKAVPVALMEVHRNRQRLLKSDIGLS
jgi:hypothetical protein